MKTLDYIDALRKLTDTGSDYAVAKLLEVPAQQMHKYVQKGQTMDNTRAARVAELLRVPLLDVIADMEIERARNDDARAYWTRLRKGIGRRAAAVLLSLLAAASMRANETDAQNLIDVSAWGPTLEQVYRTNNYTNLGLLLFGLWIVFGGWDRLQFHPKDSRIGGPA